MNRHAMIAFRIALTGLLLSAGSASWAQSEPEAAAEAPGSAARLGQWFATADENGDGKLELAEFESAERPARSGHRAGPDADAPPPRHHRRAHHRHSNPAHREAVQVELFAILDRNGDGTLTADEFKAGDRQAHQLAAKRAMFRHLDANADGALTREEISAMRRAGRDGGA